MKKYRILPLLLIVCLLLTAAFPAAAAKSTADNSADAPQSTANVSSDGVPQSTVQAAEGSYVLGSDAVKSALDEKLGANCVLLVDEDSGQYYYTRNIDAKAYPASLTKIMTLLLAVEAVERGDVQLDDTVTAYADCNADMVEGASNADIKVGETMTFEDFLYCAMISSANEACNVVAEYVCGSISAFVQRMNARAQELGCTGTHFVNPHGLPNDDHYTTAHDLYRITKEALSHELFATICNTVKHTVPATNLSDERTLSNTNGLINPESPMYRGYYYEYAKGVKTGHTEAAGYCLVSTAEKDGVRLLCVVLGGKGTARANGTTDFGSFSDTLTAYRWVFSNYGWRDIVSASDLVCEVPVRYGRDSDGVTVRPAQSISAVLPSADTAGAPIVLSVRRGADALALTACARENNGVWQLGAWIRDSMAGIGTLTYYDPATGQYGALGHGITDVDTAQLMPLASGAIMETTVKAVKKGAKGDPGELKGDFSVQRDVGTVTVNSSGGIFGTVADPDFLSGGTPVPVAAAGQITTGPATILATVSGSDVREYRVELVRLYGADEPTRNLLLRITDPALLSATGGIVQGMSGSPILQNGRIVGAVTHVLLNDPTRGYGIFIENMLDMAG